MPFQVHAMSRRELISIQSLPEREMEFTNFFPDAGVSQLLELQNDMPEYFGSKPNLSRFCQNVCCLRGGGPTTLIDTGIDAAQPNARLLPTLTEIGLTPEEIELVVITHRHGDHVGGLAREGVPVFPRARVVIGRTEYESFRDNAGQQELFEATVAVVERAGLLEVVADDAEVSPGIHFLPTFGHTPGALSVVADEDVLFLADVWHFPAQARHPEWTMAYDSDPKLAVEARTMALAMCERNGWIAAVPHTARGGLGKITRDEQGFRWVRVV